VRTELQREALEQLIPSYAVQTLVENAVRHGASPNVNATTITVTVRVDDSILRIRVEDDGVGDARGKPATSTDNSTGLARLLERARVLHGADARLEIAARPGGGFVAELALPAAEDEN
jgi:LytS/YehU family sensor histidine kinase